MLTHERIIKFYGFRKDGRIQYLFLEYATGGELFDRIGLFPFGIVMNCKIANIFVSSQYLKYFLPYIYMCVYIYIYM